MNTRYRALLGAGLLLCLASLALLLAGCGSSSKTSNNPLEIVGTWNITATSSGGGSVGLTASVVSLTPTSTGACQVGTPVGNFDINGGTTCFIADPNASMGSISNVSGSWDYPPAGFLLAVASSDPIAANSTANIGAFFVETDGTNVEVIYATGTVTAHTKTISGSYGCASGSPICPANNGTFTATHQ